MYVKTGQPINPDYKPFFKFPQSPFMNPSGSKALDLYNRGQINDTDVEIMKFVYDNKIVTLDQIQRFLPDMHINQIQDIIRKLFQNHFLNAFMLGDGNPEKRYQPDAMQFYVLDFSAPALLFHLTNDEDMLNWSATNNYMRAGKVIKVIAMTDFYLLMHQKLKNSPLAYNCYRIFSSGKTRVNPKVELIMDDQGKRKNFLFDVVDENDIFLGDKNKLNEKLLRYETMYNSDAWAKYYECDKDPELTPVLVIVCDTLNTAGQVNKMLMDTEIPNYRLTTLKLAQTGLETCLMKYSKERQGLVRIKNKLFEEKANN